MNYYYKCVEAFPKLKEFEKSWDWDWQFIQKYDVSAEEYEAIKQDLIKHWKKEKRKKEQESKTKTFL